METLIMVSQSPEFFATSRDKNRRSTSEHGGNLISSQLTGALRNRRRHHTRKNRQSIRTFRLLQRSGSMSGQRVPDRRRSSGTRNVDDGSKRRPNSLDNPNTTLRSEVCRHGLWARLGSGRGDPPGTWRRTCLVVQDDVARPLPTPPDYWCNQSIKKYGRKRYCRNRSSKAIAPAWFYVSGTSNVANGVLEVHDVTINRVDFTAGETARRFRSPR